MLYCRFYSKGTTINDLGVGPEENEKKKHLEGLLQENVLSFDNWECLQACQDICWDPGGGLNVLHRMLGSLS